MTGRPRHLGDLQGEIHRFLLWEVPRYARPSAPGALDQQTEIEHGPFERRLELGEPVAADEASASCGDGMLKISVPLENR